MASDSVFQKLVEINSEDPTVFIQHSRQYENKDSLQKTREILHLGLSLIPGSPSLSYELAELYFSHYKDPLFRAFALDSSKMYLDFANSISPEYSLVNYALYQVSLLQRNDSTDIYLDLANRKNQYVNYTGNFNRHLQEMGDSALHNKKYPDAIKYYSMAKDLHKNKFSVNLGISRCYYMLHQLDSAQMYAKQAGKYSHSLEERIDLTVLRGLIAFEKEDFRQSHRFFRDADDDKDRPDNLAQALSLFELNRLGAAKSLASDGWDEGWDNKSNAFDEMTAKAGVVYSNNFIVEMRKFLTSIGRL